MISIAFFNNFIAEIALDIIFVSWFLIGLSKENKKYFVPVTVLAVGLFPFYGLRVLSFSYILSILFFIAYSLLGLSYLVKIVRNNAMEISASSKQKIMPGKYNIDSARNIIDGYVNIYLALSLTIIALVPLGSLDNLLKIPLVLLIAFISLVLAGVYYFKKESNNKVEQVGNSLFTLSVLGIISSISLLLVSFFYLKQFGITYSAISTMVSLVPCFPLWVLSEFVYKKIRLPFIKKEEFTKKFIDNYKILVYGSLIVVVFLSDIPIIVNIFETENISGMIIWMISFVFFIANFSTILLKNLHWFEREAESARHRKKFN